MTTKTDTMEGNKYRAELCDDVWTVVGASGERWWPEEQASSAEEALRLCVEQPMRGTWRD